MQLHFQCVIKIYVSRLHLPHYYDLLAWTSDDPNWHSLKPGEIFHTDGILTKTPYKTATVADSYIAINSEGKKGCKSFLCLPTDTFLVGAGFSFTTPLHRCLPFMGAVLLIDPGILSRRLGMSPRINISCSQMCIT